MSLLGEWAAWAICGLPPVEVSAPASYVGISPTLSESPCYTSCGYKIGIKLRYQLHISIF
jgi:hypothetical protein